MAETVDCVVIGGGPGGSTVANLVAHLGHRVVLLEKERFPRYHIGESLLPGLLPVLEVLGAREDVENFGFELKTGQTFHWDPTDGHWDLRFASLGRFCYSYFVTRADFDHLLLKRAAARGAEVREERSVTEVLFDDDGRAYGVTYEDADGTHEIHARYVVDASGGRAMLAKKLRLREFTEEMKSFAMWASFEGGRRMEGHRRRHILAVTCEGGWIWVIPLHTGELSVGLVTAKDALPKGLSKSKRVDYFMDVLRDTPEVWTWLEGAKRSTPLRVARDWSYRTKHRHGPGWMLVGEAGGFIDPLLSYGVNFAMNTGLLAAIAIHNSLGESRMEPYAMRYFEDTARWLYEDLFNTVQVFYSYQCNRDSVYWRAKQVRDGVDDVSGRRDGEDRGVEGAQSFLYITAGLHDNPAVNQEAYARDEDVKAERQAAADAVIEAALAGRPGEIEPDVLAGAAPHVVLRGLEIPQPDGDIQRFDMMRRGFELEMVEEGSGEGDELTPDEAVFVVELLLDLPDEPSAVLRVSVEPAAEGRPSYARTERFALSYRTAPARLAGNDAEDHPAIVAAVDKVVEIVRAADDAGGSAATVEAVEAAVRASLADAEWPEHVRRNVRPTPSESGGEGGADAETYRFVVVEARRPGEEDSFWFFVQRRADRLQAWLTTPSFSLSYRPNALPDGRPVQTDADYARMMDFVFEAVSGLDEGAGMTLQQLAERVDAGEGTLLEPPAPWSIVRADAIGQSGSPTSLYAAEGAPEPSHNRVPALASAG